MKFDQSILEFNDRLQTILTNLDIHALEPIELGRVMKNINAVIWTSLGFVDQHITSLDGGQKIKDAANELRTRYNDLRISLDKIVAASTDLQSLKEKADAIEQEYHIFTAEVNRVKAAIENEKKNYDDLKLQYDEYVKILKDWQIALEDIETKHSKNVELYQLHFEANEAILQNITQTDGYARTKVEVFVDDISRKLIVFDKELKSLINLRDKLSVAALDQQIPHPDLLENRQ